MELDTPLVLGLGVLILVVVVLIVVFARHRSGGGAGSEPLSVGPGPYPVLIPGPPPASPPGLGGGGVVATPAPPPSPLKIYNGGAMGDAQELNAMKANAAALEAAKFRTYTPVRDGFSLFVALAQIGKDTTKTLAEKNELEYYLYAGISSIDFYQLLFACQAATFDLAPYHSDQCTMNPDNGTVVEVATASAYNKIRSIFKKCDVAALKKCIAANQTAGDCDAGLNCPGVSEKGYPMGGCVRELGGRNIYAGWDNPMLIALANQAQFQRGPDTYAHATIDGAIQEVRAALQKATFVQYRVTHPASRETLTCTLPACQLSPAQYPRWILDQIFLGSALTQVGNSSIQGFADVVKTKGVKFYGIEPFNGVSCASIRGGGS